MSVNAFTDIYLDVFRITKQKFLMRKSEQYILNFFSLVVILIGFISASFDVSNLHGIYVHDLFFKYGSTVGIFYIIIGIGSFILTMNSFLAYYLTTPIPLFMFFYNQYKMCVVLEYHEYMPMMFMSLALFLASAYFAGTLICKKN